MIVIALEQLCYNKIGKRVRARSAIVSKEIVSERGVKAFIFASSKGKSQELVRKEELLK